uniref:Uncharacterized protein n=1 Tax=Romanomermis culicivorax TaxID=13658 RepID=A0A915JN32_ROMCU
MHQCLLTSSNRKIFKGILQKTKMFRKEKWQKVGGIANKLPHMNGPIQNTTYSSASHRSGKTTISSLL